VDEVLRATSVADAAQDSEEEEVDALAGALKDLDREEMIRLLKAEMTKAARRLEFEKAASLRDRIEDLEAEAALARGPRGKR